MKFGSLFAGVGGFDLGLERTGFECAWQVEKDKFCLQVLEEHYPNVRRYTDVKEVGKHNLEPVDLICGGFPCVDLSIAGKRAGFAGEQSSLWFEFERIIDEMQPRWVIIENVQGLLSSRQGRDFGFILNALDERGYCVAWRVLDSQYFGVAQRRRRVFIVGSLGTPSCIEVLFESESSSRNIEQSEKEGQAIARTFTIRTGTHGSGGRGYLPLEERAMTLGGQPQWLEPTVMSSNQKNAKIVGSLQARDYKGVGNQYVDEGKLVWQMNHASEVYREAGDKVPTLQARMGTGGNNVPLVGVRRLTPVECERLQGFPDGWTAVCSDTQRYKQMGNAVTVNVIEWLGKRIMRAENGN